MELWFDMEKMALYRKLLNFDLYEKKIPKTIKLLLWRKNMALIKPKTVEL